MDTKERIKFRIGFSRMEKKYEWKDHVIFMGLLLGTGCVGQPGNTRSKAFIWMTCISGPVMVSRAFFAICISYGKHPVPFPLLSGSLA